MGVTEWGDMQSGCVHIVLVVLWALGTVLECYCGSSWVVMSGGCYVDFRGIDAKKKQSSGGGGLSGVRQNTLSHLL